MKKTSATWMHIRRTPYQSFAAVLTMFLTFLLGGIFMLTSAASYAILQYFESKPQMTVFFTEKADKTEADALTKTVEATGKVASVKFVSKEDALAIYKEQNKNDPLLLEMVSADILPASLEITTTDPRFLKDLEPVVKQADGVEEVVFQRDVVETLLKWTNAVRLIGGVLAALLALDSFLVIMTLIGMKVAMRRDEIEILTLIGASPWFIKFPFIYEGSLYGAIGATGAWAVITALVWWFQPAIIGFLGQIPVITAVLAKPFSTVSLLTSLGFFFSLVVTGILLGGIGSLVALRRFLRT